MKTRILTSVVALTACMGCAPVHIHQYLAQGILRPEPEFGSIGVRATTSADPHDPNSFGASHDPGATGFMIEFFGKGITTTIDVSNVRGTYSFRSGPSMDLSIQNIGREYPPHFFAVYATPTTALARIGNARIPHVLEYGKYNLAIHYDVRGTTFTATGIVQYLHKSHWEIGYLGWKD